MSIYATAVRNPIIAIVSNHIDTYPTPANLSYLWSFGSLSGLALIVQIITGVLLARHYAPEVHLAFASVEHIRRDVRGGVALRYIHANGASRFFILVYIHRFRGLYYGSYFQPRTNLWYSGIVLFFLRIAAGFRGYVLPWGQRSFWGATVITNLFSAIPGVGQSIVQLLWGGFSVDNPTLNRFFSLHYIVPIVIAARAALHLVLLHLHGSNNPLGISSLVDRVPFYPYFYVKDLFGFFIFVFIFSFFVIYAPNYLGHPDNYIEANPIVTPAHIVPEWYYLPFYAVLRSIPDKLGGVARIGLAIVILAFLPVLDTSVFRSSFFKPIGVLRFWFFFANSLSLGWIGQEIVETPFRERGRFVTFAYFAYFVPVRVALGYLEQAVITSFTVKRKDSEWEKTKTIKSAFPFLFLMSAETLHLQAETSARIFSWLPVIQLLFLALFILGLAVFLPASAELSRLIYRIISGGILRILLTSVYDVVPRYTANISLEYTNLNLDIISALIIQTADRLYIIADPLYAHFFLAFVLLIGNLFFFGISDGRAVWPTGEVEFPILVLILLASSLAVLHVERLIDLVRLLEIATLGTYVLIGYERTNRFSALAAVQYFIIGTIPSAALILAVARIYQAWGGLTFHELELLTGTAGFSPKLPLNPYAENLAQAKDRQLIVPETLNSISEVLINGEKSVIFNSPKIISKDVNYTPDWVRIVPPTVYEYLPILAACLLFFNLRFKITAVPFHFWAPSVYGNAPLAAVTFLSILSKAIVLAVIAKLLWTFLHRLRLLVVPILLLVSILSVFGGRLGALVEQRTKRFYVYSSRGHVGFILAGLSFLYLSGVAAQFHYRAIYIATSYARWFFLILLGPSATHLVHLSRLKQYPELGRFLTFLLFSRSGIPPLAGFYAKLDIFITLIESSRFYTAYLLFFFSVASFFYYLRLIKIFFFDGLTVSTEEKVETTTPKALLWVLSFLTLIILLYGIFVERPLLLAEVEALKALCE